MGFRDVLGQRLDPGKSEGDGRGLTLGVNINPLDEQGDDAILLAGEQAGPDLVE
jgi:hypothetical protein